MQIRVTFRHNFCLLKEHDRKLHLPQLLTVSGRVNIFLPKSRSSLTSFTEFKSLNQFSTRFRWHGYVIDSQGWKFWSEAIAALYQLPLPLFFWRVHLQWMSPHVSNLLEEKLSGWLPLWISQSLSSNFLRYFLMVWAINLKEIDIKQGRRTSLK